MKKRGKSGKIVCLLLITLLLVGFASASFWSDFWNGITGKATGGSSGGGSYSSSCGDGFGDLAVFHPGTGTWSILKSRDGFEELRHGFAGTLPASADFDGDGERDIAVYLPEGGKWYISFSSGNIPVHLKARYNAAEGYVHYGSAGSVPVPGDYDNDGKADLGVVYRSDSNWIIEYSSNRSVYKNNFGWSATIPAPGDFDGDGKMDLAVFCPRACGDDPDGHWWIWQSSTNQIIEKDFGWSAVVPAPSDFDNDGKTDLAVYYPPEGKWYILYSKDGKTDTELFGWSEALPAPGDYDGCAEQPSPPVPVPECQTDADCGTSTSRRYCQNNNACVSSTSYSCQNGTCVGVSGGGCTTCSYGCANGSCISGPSGIVDRCSEISAASIVEINEAISDTAYDDENVVLREGGWTEGGEGAYVVLYSEPYFDAVVLEITNIDEESSIWNGTNYVVNEIELDLRDNMRSKEYNDKSLTRVGDHYEGIISLGSYGSYYAVAKYNDPYFDENEMSFSFTWGDGATYGNVGNQKDTFYCDINQTTEWCFDTDGGLDYYTKGEVNTSVSPGLMFEDYCLDNRSLIERHCLDRANPNNFTIQYACPGICQDGACVGGTYEILNENVWAEKGNVVEIGNEAIIRYQIVVSEEDSVFVPDRITKVISAPNGQISVPLTKSNSYCQDYVGGSCIIEFKGNVYVKELGKYYFPLMSYKPIIIYGVEQGFISNNLVLDPKYSPEWTYGYYSSYMDFISLNVNYAYYAGSNKESEAGVFIYEDEVGPQNYIKDIFREIEGENFVYNLEDIDGNKILMIKGGDKWGSVRAAIWQSKNKIVLYVYGSENNLDVGDITGEEILQGMIGRQVKIDGNAKLNEFDSMSQEIIRGYLKKHPSTMTDEYLSCLPNWECTLTPLVCPEYGQQTKVCNDLSRCLPSTTTIVECTPGLCSGCFDDDSCIPYGIRLEKDNIPSYCDIDGNIKSQKTKDPVTGDWSTCQNNYECKTNICSDGQCVEVFDMLEAANVFKGVFVRVVCRVSNILDAQGYAECLYEFLGEEEEVMPPPSS